MKRGWVFFLGILGVAGILMSMFVSIIYLDDATYQLGRDGISTGLLSWIFLSAIWGAIMLLLGTFLYTQGTPISLKRIPKNRAFLILSINRFNVEGSIHLLVVPLNKENATPCYLILNSKRFPKSAIPGQVIVKINEKKLQVLTMEDPLTEESPTEKQDAH